MLIKLMIIAVLAGGGLARSTVSSHRVQRQPPAGSCSYRGHGLYALPDPRCTPGAIGPAVTQANIHHTICVAGYTARVRPPEDVTEIEKRLSLEVVCDGRLKLATAQLMIARNWVSADRAARARS